MSYAREMYLEGITDTELQAELLWRCIRRWDAKIAKHEAGLGVMREKQARRVAELEQLEMRAAVRGTDEPHKLTEGGSTPPPATNTQAAPDNELPTCRYCHKPVADMAAHECPPMREKAAEVSKGKALL